MGTTAPWETTCRVKCPSGILPKIYWVVVKDACTLWPYVVLWQEITCKPRVVSRGPQLALLWKHPRTQKFKLNKVNLRIRKKLETLLYSLEIRIWCSKRWTVTGWLYRLYQTLRHDRSYVLFACEFREFTVYSKYSMWVRTVFGTQYTRRDISEIWIDRGAIVRVWIESLDGLNARLCCLKTK
jgi:hypothetical protein